jgi:tRNA (cytidine32/uridine32-2'-O)-methyltransferase
VQSVDTLDEALAGSLVGTSARRTLPWPMLDPRECGLKAWRSATPLRWCGS